MAYVLVEFATCGSQTVHMLLTVCVRWGSSYLLAYSPLVVTDTSCENSFKGRTGLVLSSCWAASEIHYLF